MLEKKVLNLGTRSSPLAMAQANLAANAIRSFFPEYEVNIYPVRTSGDKDRVRSLVQFGGTGVFVKELEDALLEKKIDLNENYIEVEYDYQTEEIEEKSEEELMKEAYEDYHNGKITEQELNNRLRNIWWSNKDD